MKFLIAPNAFKGTIKANEAASLIQTSTRSVNPEIECDLFPIADGGDGTCELLIEALGLEKVSLWGLNAIGKPHHGFFGWDSTSSIAYLDISTFSGLGDLTESQKNPWVTSTFGSGLAIQKALELGAKEIVIGLGGSATVDLGLGILQAIGFLFLDEKGRELPSFCPEMILKIKHIQLPLRAAKVKFTCLCDVRNNFFGNAGAVRVFGPQKGLLPEDLGKFELATNELVSIFSGKSKKPFLDLPGFGAAGGIALGLDFFFPTTLLYGAAFFFEKTKLKEKIAGVDWIITGEGRYDFQSREGKACFELLKMARALGKKVILISSGDDVSQKDFDRVWKLDDLDFTSPFVKKQARENLHRLVLNELNSMDLS
jgi:glycerate kinase